MNTIQQGILTLLNSAIKGEALALPPDFTLEQAKPLIKSHHIAPLVYEGALRCGIPAQDPLMQQLFRGYCRALMISEGQLREAERVYHAFDEAGIDYMPLKGGRLKALYPKPELRPMGDADILIRMDQYESIAPLMRQLGFDEDYESDHELVWKTDKLVLELHKHLIPSYNEDFFTYFGTGWQRARLRHGRCHEMRPEDEWIFLFVHFAKHFRDGGIGCHHVVDLWLYRQANPAMDEAYIRGELEKLQILEFYDNLLRLLGFWFDGEAGDGKTRVISRYIFASGSFGQDRMRVMSRMVRDARRGERRHNGRLEYLRQTAFPDVATLRDKYTVLKKAPWLLPAVWIYRPVYKVLFETGTLKGQQKKLEALTEENLDAHRQLLAYMGLEYRF